jgi:hypothetical protein
MAEELARLSCADPIIVTDESSDEYDLVTLMKEIAK